MTKISELVNPMVKVHAVRIQTSALGLMEGRQKTPKSDDTTKLPGGVRLGRFWAGCKFNRRCGRPPYDQLLVNPVLKTNYR